MNPLPKVVIVVGRCQRTRQGFGIRLAETDPGCWSGDWAFALSEQAARKEGYDRTEIRGQFLIADTYPGCPHCGTGAIFQCSCGKVACWDGESRKVKCPWCGQTVKLSGAINRLSAGGDR